ncbi:hypothetical protein GCM10010387_56890 [Streptomyces inusitatus]|uniref:DUF8017 domain-containing protein n=1 Tax=Streptomyces inusitatus TaxID=68221 RepID=A0A918QM27_9ACTN|nr:hypothetical protein [Streptomyces inusitatus]GGZ55400.1 hypothetical protein GCM10010387_56890 [Streptomyces inusitatus]
MWPEQQPPGGQNPQQPNPYQQPGQPANPYLQPGYQQPNPYTAPTVASYAAGPPVGGPRPPREGRRRTALIAAVAATAVVAAAAVTWAVVLKDGGAPDGEPSSGKGGVAAASDPAPSEPGDDPAVTATATATEENPRSATDADAVPTVKGWKVVTNPKHGTRFDVPAEWEVPSSGMSTFLEDQKKGGGVPLVTMSAPAHLAPSWCTADANKDGVPETSGLASAGTKGGKGAKDTQTAAYNEAGIWVWGAYAQKEPKGTVEITPAKPHTTASGLKGSISTATATGVRKTSKCATDGKSVAFTFKDATGEFRTWVLYAAKGVPDEIPDATILRILSTLRTAGKATN